MGDTVGSNDMELSNLLWFASARMQALAEKYEEDVNA